MTFFQQINAAELLRLYLEYDYLHEAGTLTLEYIDAVLGKGHEYFGLDTFLHGTAPAVWLPYTCIDQLMAALSEVARADPNLKQVNIITLKLLVTKIDAQWEGMGDVGSARYEPALLPPCPTIIVLSYSN